MLLFRLGTQFELPPFNRLLKVYGPVARNVTPGTIKLRPSQLAVGLVLLPGDQWDHFPPQFLDVSFYLQT